MQTLHTTIAAEQMMRDLMWEMIDLREMQAQLSSVHYQRSKR